MNTIAPIRKPIAAGRKPAVAKASSMTSKAIAEISTPLPKAMIQATVRRPSRDVKAERRADQERAAGGKSPSDCRDEIAFVHLSVRNGLARPKRIG